MDNAHFNFDGINHSRKPVRNLTPSEEGSPIQDVLAGLAITAFVIGVLLFGMVFGMVQP